jgi:hypothetical protein
MSTYNQLPIRLEADLISSPPVAPIDANTGLQIQFWARQGIVVQCAVFDNTGACVDLSNLTYAQLVIQPAADSLVPSVVKTVLAGAIIPTITRANWDAGIAAQVTFTLSNAETDLSLSGGLSAPYWIQFQGQTTAGANIVYAAGPITVFTPGSLPASSTGFVSHHAQSNGGGNMVVTPTSQVHTEVITITGSAGTRQVVVGAAGLDAGARIGLKFVLPATAGINLQVYDQATSGPLLTTVTSDSSGFTPTAKANLFFDGANLQRDELIIPAFGQQTP